MSPIVNAPLTAAHKRLHHKTKIWTILFISSLPVPNVAQQVCELASIPCLRLLACFHFFSDVFSVMPAANADLFFPESTIVSACLHASADVGR
jgi:hypothetical protein